MKKFQIFGLLAILVIGGCLMFSRDQVVASVPKGIVPQPTPRPPRARPRSNTISNPVNTNANIGYIGGTDDGQSIRRRHGNSNQHLNANGAGGNPAPVNTNAGANRAASPNRPKRRPKTKP